MPQRFDLVVIGTGASAGVVAHACREAGWRVAVIDSRPYGGTCANRGCDPKKVLVGAADLVDRVRRLHGRGVAGEVRIDWPELMRFKQEFTGPVPESRERGFREAGIATFHGRARFTGRWSVEAGGEPIEASKFLIAAGAAPARLEIPGEDLLIDSDRFLDLEQLPKSIAFAGGGYIAFEFAHLAARAGARVTILHGDMRPLRAFDRDLVRLLVEHTRARGIDVRLGSRVAAVEPGFVVHTDNEESIRADLVVHAAGRVPQVGDLNLGAAGIDATQRGITVNEFLQSVSNPGVYAAGDVAATDGPALTPIAGYEGRIAAANLINGNHAQADYSGFASVVFTIPPLAMTGLTDDAARAAGIDFEARHEVTTGWYSSKRVAEECSAYKVLVERGTGRIVGAHLLGGGADEAINVYALAIRHGLSAQAVKGTLFAYPTHGSDLQYMV